MASKFAYPLVLTTLNGHIPTFFVVMSTVSVIVTIILLLAALVSYAVVAESLRKKEEERRRLMAALLSKSRLLQFILEGCPIGFLPKALEGLVLRNLLEVTDSLVNISPEDPKYRNNLDLIREMVSTSSAREDSGDFALDDTEFNVNAVKASLSELYKLVYRLESEEKVHRTISESYRAQIKQVLLRVSIDNLVTQGEHAAQEDKLPLAIHHYEAAVRLIEREGEPRFFEEKLLKLKETIAELKEVIEETSESNDETEGSDLNPEWDNFEDDKSWQKRSAYD